MSTSYTFGPFRLDVAAKVLFRGGEPTALGRRAVALLQALLERPRCLVSKQALVDAVWSSVALEESNLSVQVAAIRRLLREEPGGASWIETRPCRGYRFVGPAVTKHGGDVAPDLLHPPTVPDMADAPQATAVAGLAAAVQNGHALVPGKPPASASGAEASPRSPNIMSCAPSKPTCNGEFSDIVQLIYDAGLAFERWPIVLERLAEMLGASMTCLVRQDVATSTGAMITVRADANAASRYAGYYAKLNVFAQRAGTMPAQTVMTDRAVVTKEELLKSEFYADFLRLPGVHE